MIVQCCTCGKSLNRSNTVSTMNSKGQVVYSCLAHDQHDFEKLAIQTLERSLSDRLMEDRFAEEGE